MTGAPNPPTPIDPALGPLIERLRPIFPDAIRTAVLHDGGDDFRAVEINGEWIFRFARRNTSVSVLVVEERFLRAFARRAPLPVPEPEFRCAAEGFVGYRKIAGEPLTPRGFSALDAAARARIAGQLGEFLAALHAFPAAEAVALGVSEGWGGWRPRARDHFVEAVAPRLSPAARAGALARFEEFFRQAPAAVVVHGDLCLEDHVFYDAARRELSGVIDFGDLTRDDPAQDFIDILDKGGPEFFTAVFAAYVAAGGPARAVEIEAPPATAARPGAETPPAAAGPALLERVRLRLRVAPLFDAAYAQQYGFPERFAQRLAEIERAFGA